MANSLAESDGLDEDGAEGGGGVKYEGISKGENELLSQKEYSLEHLKKYCSDPAEVAEKMPEQCCQAQRHIRDVKYLLCDPSKKVQQFNRYGRKLQFAAVNPTEGLNSHCREVTQPDNLFDANLKEKLMHDGFRNRMKHFASKSGYAGALDAYDNIPVDLQPGKMCVFLQINKPPPKIGIHLAGVKAVGQESPFMNCYSKKGANSMSYIDVNYAKGDDILNMPLIYDYFDYTGDGYVKDTEPLMYVSPSFIGDTIKCELLKEDKRTIIAEETFDFEHVMRECHLHQDPGQAGKESKIFKSNYNRRRNMLGLFGGDDVREEKPPAIPYMTKKLGKSVTGNKKCCASRGEWKFCIYSSELPAVHHLPLPHLTSVVTSGQWYPTRQSASLVELWGQNEPVLRHGSSDDGLGQ